MKPSRLKTKKPPAAPPSATAGPSGSPRTRWWFRLAALLSPLVLLVFLELVLRLAGVGYPTSFFLPVQVNGQAFLRENPKFGWTYFPPSMARTPRPLLFAAKKPADTVRIIILGESAAMGDPEPAYGFPRQLERILQAQHPAQHVEVINAAMTAINSHAIREIACDCRRAQADFWLIYAGNNEVVGPLGAGTIFGRQAPALTTVRLNLALRRTRIGQLLGSLLTRNAEPPKWEGMEMFLGQQVGRDDPRLTNVYQHFAANLSDIIEYGHSAGAKVLMATVPVNLKDSPPFGSQHCSGLSPADLLQWEKNFAAGRQAETNGSFSDAIAAYQRAATLDGQHAELIFRRAECELQGSDAVAAAKDFRLARDLDTLRFRTDSRLSQVVRQTAEANAVPLLDLETECAQASKDHIPGGELFYDHVHLNFSGNFLAAKLFASAIEKDWPGATAKPGAIVQSESEMATWLAFTEFDHRRVLEEMRARLQQPPFSSQSNFGPRDRQLKQRITALKGTPLEFVPAYRDALALAPADWMLHDNFARLLEAAGDKTAAAEQWQEVVRLMPYWPDAWLSLGYLADQASEYAQAQEFCLQALQRQPGSVETLNELGLIAAAQGKADEALRHFRKALAIQPGYSAARVNLAVSLAKGGDTNKAAAEYREVLRREANNIDARLNLGNLLGREGRPEQALALYQEALRLQPEHALAHANLAKAFVAQGRHADAVAHYEAALRTRPELAQAQLELGLELAQLGKQSEALARLAEAVRLKPDWADARFNYGIALARARRYAEAVEEFQATLKLQPEHPLAARTLAGASKSASAQGQ